MRNAIILCTALLLAAGTLFGGVIHETKTKVTFKGLGNFTRHQTIFVQDFKQMRETQNKFEAESMMGKMVSKFLFKQPHTSEIVDLQAMKIFKIYHNKKEYEVFPIEQYSESEAYSQHDYEAGETEEPMYTEEPSEEQESQTRIIRRVFKVVPTNKQKSINGFPCNEYNIFWVVEWENTETGERGKDSLFVEVWTTDQTDEIAKALNEEQTFQKKYLEKIGMDADMLANDLLGLNWLQMMKNMNTEQRESGKGMVQDSHIEQELKQLKGYPIFVNGKYFATRPRNKSEVKKEEEKSFDISNPTGMFGNFLKKKLKKKLEKKPKKHAPDMVYQTELIKFSIETIDKKYFQVPFGYKLIKN